MWAAKSALPKPHTARSSGTRIPRTSASANTPCASWSELQYTACNVGSCANSSDNARRPSARLLGAGTTRGIALAFLLASLIGLIVTVLALMSRPYRVLSATYRDSLVNESLAADDPAVQPTDGEDEPPVSDPQE